MRRRIGRKTSHNGEGNRLVCVLLVAGQSVSSIHSCSKTVGGYKLFQVDEATPLFAMDGSCWCKDSGSVATWLNALYSDHQDRRHVEANKKRGYRVREINCESREEMDDVEIKKNKRKKVKKLADQPYSPVE